MIQKVEFKYLYSYFSSTVASMVYTAPMILHAININKATTTAILKVYDCNTTTGAGAGNLMMDIEAVTNGPIMFDCAMTSGCYINPTGAGVNFTVSYRPL